MPNPRKSAVKALIKVEADGGFSNLVIDNVTNGCFRYVILF